MTELSQTGEPLQRACCSGSPFRGVGEVRRRGGGSSTGAQSVQVLNLGASFA